MLVKMLRNPARSFDCLLTEGQVGEVDESIGKHLVENQIAELIERELKAVPVPPEIAQSKPVEIAGVKKVDSTKTVDQSRKTR